MTDREKLIELIQNAVGGCARHWAETIADYLIENGVVIREKGEWIIKEEKDTFGFINHFHCSQCQRESKDKGNFCPNCGADMRGETE